MRFKLQLLLCLVGISLWAAPPRNGVGCCPSHVKEVSTCQAALGPRRTVGHPTTIPRVLVIMANFSDYSFVSSKAEVDSMFNAQSWIQDDAKGSVRQYFSDQSSGAYNPQFDVVGPVTLSQTYSYYGAGTVGTDKSGYMITEACALVDDSVDFSQYDLNGDGRVDMVFVLYAGFGENDPPQQISGITASNLVWPHYSRLSVIGYGTNRRVFDGKTVEDYECANELDGLYSTSSQPVVAGIGVLVHEFCHGLGLPDLYYTSKPPKNHKTLGFWSEMDYGPYADDMHSPPSLTAYERWYLGWLNPELLSEAKNDTLRPLSEVNEARYFNATNSVISDITNPNPTTFYLLENRQQTGWDIGLPGSGLLLYKIQFSASMWNGNCVNNNPDYMGIDLLEADGLTPDKTTNEGYGKPGDAYPYGMLDSITILPNLPITQIRQETDGNISYLVCGGVSEPGPTTLLPLEMTNDKAEKVLLNGHLYIRRGKALYTVTGVRM